MLILCYTYYYFNICITKVIDILLYCLVKVMKKKYEKNMIYIYIYIKENYIKAKNYKKRKKIMQPLSLL